jgi:hypothetical protein
LSTYSLTAYEELLQTVLSCGYRFVDFAGLDPDSDERQVILRHDVDLIPRLAVDVAEIDARCGAAATFFFLPRSHVYNLFSANTCRSVTRIAQYGHAVGIHCALPEPVPDTEAALADLVRRDAALARQAFSGIAPVFAWHSAPQAFFARWAGLAVPGFVNAYDDRFFKQITFVSDSNARRSPDEIADMFRGGSHRKVQLLLHPVIWMCGGATMAEVLANAWTYLVREIEVELNVNDTYRQRLPHGIPDTAIRALANAVSAGAV